MVSRYLEIDRKLEEIKEEIEDIWRIINDIKSTIPKDSKKVNSSNSLKKGNKIIVVDDRTKWKRVIYGQINVLINKNGIFKKRSEVLHYLYDYMRKNYGIVWEQDIREYKERFGIDYRPKTIDVLYDNATYRSIFEAVLVDMIENSHSAVETTDRIGDL